MAIDKASRWRWKLFGVAACGVVLVSGFMACASDETLFDSATGAGGSGGSGGGGGTCDLATCPDPPFSGLEKCCTADGMCGVKSGPTSTCYPPGQSGSGGGGGMGGMGGGKL